MVREISSHRAICSSLSPVSLLLSASASSAWRVSSCMVARAAFSWLSSSRSRPAESVFSRSKPEISSRTASSSRWFLEHSAAILMRSSCRPISSPFAASSSASPEESSVCLSFQAVWASSAFFCRAAAFSRTR